MGWRSTYVMKHLNLKFARKLTLIVVSGALVAACGASGSGMDIEGAWARATAANAKTGAAYMQITASEDDRLVAVNVDEAVAAEAQIHEVAKVETEGDAEPMMSMRELENGLELPAGEAVELKPGGYHIMFMKIAAPFEEGDSIELELVFETGDPVTVNVDVMTEAP